MAEVYYKDKNVLLIQGNCLEVMPKLKIKFDACITDPPYGTTACKWDNIIPFEPMWDYLKVLIKTNGAICLFGSEPFSSKLRCSNLAMFKYDWVWIKNNAVGFVNATLKPMNKHEVISVFSEGKTSNCNKHNMIYNPQNLVLLNKMKCSSNRKDKENTYWRKNGLNGTPYLQKFTNYPTTDLYFSRPSNAVHPTQKPVELVEYLIKTYTSEGDTVLDFTCGSGTTLIAGLNTGRRVVGIELESKYCEITKNRMKSWYKEHENN